MKPARLFVLLFATPLMVPVACTVLTLPMTHAYSRLEARDLQAGEAGHLRPTIVLQDRGSGEIVLVALDDLADLRQARPALSPRLDPVAGERGEDDDRYLWRQSPAGTEVVRVSENYTHTFRYAVAADGGIVPLHSRLFSIGHMFQAMLAAFVLATGMLLLARRMQRRFVAAGS